MEKSKKEKVSAILSRGAVVMATLWCLVPSVARADIIVIPPQDYEEECTLEEVHYNDMECVVCDVDRYKGNDCSELYSPDGYEQVCVTAGYFYNGVFWEEIWCRDAPGEKGPAGDPDGEGGCAYTRSQAPLHPIPELLLLLALVGTALLLRRKS